MASILLSPG
uniref:Uncharacterized protein n=1 Tax=Arundo donax TaxID=35708 RepID=A0A0A8YU97_ARUDO